MHVGRRIVVRWIFDHKLSANIPWNLSYTELRYNKMIQMARTYCSSNISIRNSEVLVSQQNIQPAIFRSNFLRKPEMAKEIMNLWRAQWRLDTTSKSTHPAFDQRELTCYNWSHGWMLVTDKLKYAVTTQQLWQIVTWWGRWHQKRLWRTYKQAHVSIYPSPHRRPMEMYMYLVNSPFPLI